MFLFDSHSHVNFKDFENDYKDVINFALKKDIGIMIAGSQESTSKRAVAIAEEFADSEVYAAVGLHPIQLFEMHIKENDVNFKSRAEDFDYEKYKVMAKNNKVKAIGEVGIEYYRIKDLAVEERKVKQKQADILNQQIDLAKELDLPLILHCRSTKEDQNKAYLDLLNILKNQTGARGVLHSYGCFDKKITQQFLDLGLYIGFNGIITFADFEKYQNLIVGLPLDRILVETDCPYLTPEPYRGKRNQPAYVEFVALKIAQIYRKKIDEISKITVANSRKLFDL